MRRYDLMGLYQNTTLRETNRGTAPPNQVFEWRGLRGMGLARFRLPVEFHAAVVCPPRVSDGRGMQRRHV